MLKTNYSENKKAFLYLSGLFFIILLLRIHTLFIDYYGRDELVSISYALLNKFQGMHLNQKGHIFTWFFQTATSLFGYTPISFHICGIFIIFFTCIFIFILVKRMYRNSSIALCAAFLYGISLSYGNQEIIEINGEFLINFFFIIGIYYFYLYLVEKKYWAIIPFLISTYLAYQTKNQGIYLLFLPLFYYSVFIPLHHFNKKQRFFYVIFLLLFLFLFFLFLIADYEYHLIASNFLRQNIFYIVAKFIREGAWYLIFLKPIHRYGMLILYCIPLWVSAFITIHHIIKKKKKTNQDIFILTIFFALFFTPFLGGIALFFHYFILLYLPLVITAAALFYRWFCTKKGKIFIFSTTLPFIILSWGWFMKDIYIKYYNNDLFYKYYKQWNLAQMILLGQNNDYLLPNPYTKRVLKIIQVIPKKDPVFIFGQAAEVAYFSKLNNSCNFWLELGIFDAYNSPLQKRTLEDTYLSNCLLEGDREVNNKAPLWFIDISADSMTGLDKLDPNIFDPVALSLPFFMFNYKQLGPRIIYNFPFTYSQLQKHFSLYYDKKGIALWKRKDN